MTKLLCHFLVIFLLHSGCCKSDSKYELELDTEVEGRIIYSIYKAKVPICQHIVITGTFWAARVKEGSGEPVLKPYYEMQQVSTKSAASDVWYGTVLQRGRFYKGYVTSPVDWIRADLTINCKLRMSEPPIEVAERTIFRRLSGLIGLYLHPRKGRVYVTVAVTNLAWQSIRISCKTSYTGYNGESLNKNIVCFSRVAHKVKNGAYFVGCGATLHYGVRDYACSHELSGFGLSFSGTTKIFYYPGFMQQVARPLKPLLIGYPKVHSKKLIMEFRYQHDSVKHVVRGTLEPDVRFVKGLELPKPTVEEEIIDVVMDGRNELFGDGFTAQTFGANRFLHPPSWATNGDFNDFSQVTKVGDKWWLVEPVHWQKGIDFVKFYCNKYNRGHLSMVYFISSPHPYSVQILPSITSPNWLKHHYQHAPFGTDVNTFQFFPQLQGQRQFAFYSINPTDPLTLVEVQAYAGYDHKLAFNLPQHVGIDYIACVQMYARSKHAERKSQGDMGGPWTPSEKNCIRWFQLSSKVSRRVCDAFTYDELREYFGCTTPKILNPTDIAYCKNRSFSGLAEILKCIKPNMQIQILPTDLAAPFIPSMRTADINVEDLDLPSEIYEEPDPIALLGGGAREGLNQWMTISLLLMMCMY